MVGSARPVSHSGRDARPPSPRFRADIEGLRAVGVGIVVAYHAGVPGFSGGFVGVDVFFVVSGYLITWLLVDEVRRTGTIDLARFYARRIRRLLPAMALVLLVAALATIALFAPFEQQQLARTWAATALYIANLHFAVQALDYHGADASSNLLLHTWSLSVEEQFYLLWPWLILAGVGVVLRRRASFGRLVPVLLAATVGSLILSIWFTSHLPRWAFYAPWTRAWEFGVGGLAVLLPLERTVPFRLLPVARRLLAWIGMGGLVLSTVLFDRETPFPGSVALLPVFSTAFVLQAGMMPAPGDLMNRLLSLRPMQVIGRLSYSWYLWHWPALVLVGVLTVGPALPVRLMAVLASLVMAALSYELLENPVRHHRWLAGRPARSFMMAAAISLSAVVGVVAWEQAADRWSGSPIQQKIVDVATERPAIYADGCDHFGTARVEMCVYGDSASAQVVALVGDSHAMQFFPAVRAAADTLGWRLVVLTLSGCPMVDVPVLFDPWLGRPYPECVAWRVAVRDTLASLRPNLTLVGSATAYDVSPAAWREGTRAILADLVAVNTRVAFILDPPYSRVDAGRCLARAAWRWHPLDPDCRPIGDPWAEQLVAAQRDAVRQTDGVELIDLRDRVCVIGACEAYHHGVIRYRDWSHISVEFAQTFTPDFERVLSQTQF